MLAEAYIIVPELYIIGRLAQHYQKEIVKPISKRTGTYPAATSVISVSKIIQRMLKPAIPVILCDYNLFPAR